MSRHPLPGDLHSAPAPHSAAAAHLHYVRRSAKGILRSGRTQFRYHCDGVPVRDRETLQRIRALAIPPAWTEVWICRDPAGHLQATGKDAKGRVQYRYHAEWSAVRSETKYAHALAFGAQLHTMRKRLEQDLKRPGLPAEKVLAVVVSIMDRTQIRVGHDAYAKENGTFGLSTLLDRHAKMDGGCVRFSFKGKTGIQHDIRLGCARLSKLVMRCRELPGQDLFQYIGADGNASPIDSGMVNDYIRCITGGQFTSKDIRTWKGTVHAVRSLLDQGPARTATERRTHVNAALDQVAKQLGNTRTVCRKYYVHPLVVEAYEADRLAEVATAVRAAGTLSSDERIVLRLLGTASARRAIGRASEVIRKAA